MTIRWGILGCGDVAEVKSGPGFQRAKGSQLVAVMRRHGDLAADFARRHGVPSWYDDADALLADRSVDAVYIATPPGEHERLALAACAARKPTYVEKPMARNHGECSRMADAFTAAGVPLFVAYYRRALPRFRKARDLIAEGALGRLSNVSYRLAGPYHLDVEARMKERAPLPWRLQAEHSGGGLFLDLGCHTLDILDFLVGPLEQVHGVAASVVTPHFVEDSVAMSFRTPSGVPGTAQWNFASTERADEIVVSGERGELRLSTFGNEPVEWRQGERREHFDLPNPRHIQEPMIQTIVDQLEGRGICDSTGASGARTSAVIDKVLLGYYGTRGDGFWKDPHTWPGQRSSRWLQAGAAPLTTPERMSYRGSCHCGALRFRLRSEVITTGIRCNCSFCVRKGAVMSSRYYAPADFEELSGIESLGVYRFGDIMVNHYFCKTCSTYPFHDPIAKPGHYRINLGCLEDFDPLGLEISLIDGKAY